LDLGGNSCFPGSELGKSGIELAARGGSVV